MGFGADAANRGIHGGHYVRLALIGVRLELLLFNMTRWGWSFG